MCTSSCYMFVLCVTLERMLPVACHWHCLLRERTLALSQSPTASLPTAYSRPPRHACPTSLAINNECQKCTSSRYLFCSVCHPCVVVVNCMPLTPLAAARAYAAATAKPEPLAACPPFPGNAHACHRLRHLTPLVASLYFNVKAHVVRTRQDLRVTLVLTEVRTQRLPSSSTWSLRLLLVSQAE